MHVHTFPDSDPDPSPDLERYVDSAIANGIAVLGITDHNTTRFVRDAMRAAEGKELTVLPGIEISTHDGHLLALFAPEDVAALELLANPNNLQLRELSATEQRSKRSVLDLVEEIHRLGGLAIPAHVDATNGVCSRLRQAELVELLTSPALAGLEFRTREALSEWFSDRDPDPDRVAAWKAREQNSELLERGLGRLMSSDAHSPDNVGRDRASRTLTRLRLDDINFSAICNAILLNPKARCKAEAVLPAVYPRVLSASFEGGFLDGVTMNFSPNLNCLIGGRGSGKSTALLSIRAALGAPGDRTEDIDDPDRMPEVTTVRFIDSAGSERIAVRRRGGQAVDDQGSPIRLRMADLGQDESGRLARGYRDDPALLLSFLDTFIVRHRYEEQEASLQAQLEDNAAEVTRTSGVKQQILRLEREHQQLEATLRAAPDGKVEAIARWAGLLASQAPLLDAIDTALVESSSIVAVDGVDLDALAREFGVDLTRRPAIEFVDGESGLRKRLLDFATRRSEIASRATQELRQASIEARERLGAWKADQADLELRLQQRQRELEEQGLRVEAGAIREIADRLNSVKTTLRELRRRQDDHDEALQLRAQLVATLHENRLSLLTQRDATLRRIAASANAYSDDLTIRVFYEKAAINRLWIRWLTQTFGFQMPRVGRLAATITPRDFAHRVVHDRAAMLSLEDHDGSRFFADDTLPTAWNWSQIFTLETMRLPDRPRIEVQRRGTPERRQFDHLSAGQQRSVLLSLLLCAERNQPLILDQPEDHLDGRYIAQAVVRHLEAAKERRQILIATHSANLTVLGDAELVIPMQVADGHGHPYDLGAVDRPRTRDQVCALLEGGSQAYRKRGQRYGFRFANDEP